jgi:hypothetical protein
MSVTPASTIPISVDYTGRDYYSIREQLIARIQDRIPEWTASDPSDFGVALVEAFAYMGDLISYYIDRTANEFSLATATQRNSLLNIAQTYGYIPSGYRNAIVDVTFFNNNNSSASGSLTATGNGTTITYVGSNVFVVNGIVTVTGFSTSSFNVTSAVITAASATQFTVAVTGVSGAASGTGVATMVYPSITIPQGTVVSGEVITADVVKPVYFTTTSDAVVSATSTETVSAEEGRYINVVDTASDSTYGQQIGVSTQKPNMSFELPNTPVVDGSISVYVQYGTIYSKWTQVQHLLDYGPNDLVYTVKSDGNNVVSINFGDGVSGAIPVNSSVIRAMYLVGGGILGNISANVIDTLSYIPSFTSSQTTALASAITVSNGTAALGGTDPESNDEIRVQAPLVLRSSNRAITLEDYKNLSLSVTGVGKANAYSSTWTSVTVYIAPSRNVNDTDVQPGLTETGAVSPEYTDLAASVTDYLSDKLLIGSSVTVQPPSYSDLVITIQYVKLPQYTQTETDVNIKKALLLVYGYTGMNFQDTIYPQDIEYVLNQTEGIKTAKITSLYKSGSTITGNTSNVKVGYNLDTVASGYITYTVNQRHAMKAGGTVTITGLSATGFNVSSATIVAVDEYRIVVANATTGTASGTGIVTGFSPLNGFANEIFRFKESNMNIGAYSG